MGVYTIIVAVQPSAAHPRADLPGFEFLMVQNRRRGGRWELPGGRALAHEDPAVCACREFLEETGHELASPVIAQRRHGPLGDGYVFTGRIGDRRGEPVEDEIQGVAFFATLPPRARLSFPDDPYPETFAAVRSALANPRAGPDDPR